MLLVRRGSANDPRGKEGLAAITADMLDEGSGALSAIELHEALAKIGAQFDIDIGSDATLVSMTTLSRFADRGLALMADMVVRPAFTEGDFMRVRQLRLHRLTQLRDMPGAVADRTFIRLLYGDHPYGHTPMGSEQALASMTIDEVRAFHARAIRPSAATLVAVGDCDHADVLRLATDVCRAGTRAGDDDDADADWPPAPPAVTSARLNIVPRPGAQQSELRIGHVAVPRETRPITTRSSPRTWCSAANSSAAST